MQRREFITATVGMAAAVASASQAFAQDYPDAGAIKKMPVGEGAAGAAKKGIEGAAGAAKTGIEGEAGAAKKGIIEKITEAIGGGEMEEMHPPKYKALEDSAAKCVVTGNDCLRHCYGMFSMKDTSMAACANAAFQLVAACAALTTLAAVNSEHTGHLAKTVEMICNDCKKECDNFPKVTECKTCGDACKACADECQKIAT
jgi:Cys-rich four helix bundle protein (predicted Tat secretion target)